MTSAKKIKARRDAAIAADMYAAKSRRAVAGLYVELSQRAETCSDMRGWTHFDSSMSRDEILTKIQAVSSAARSRAASVKDVK